MTYDEAMAGLTALARASGGRVVSAQVEADETLSQDPALVRAAARALAGRTNVFSADEPDGRKWFPYSSLTFSDFGGGA